MGIIWRSAMPLLPTLAALVIIVHSAEEDLETEYRHDLRPRILDTGTPSYDQPWRAMEAEHPVQQIRNTENWDNESPDEMPKRRRLGRKRKRRPQTSSNEDLEPPERYVYPEDSPRPYYDVAAENTHQTTEIPKRRRKKPENRPIRWTDDVVDIDRPMRRRGQRRKRPSLDTWPELSEFRRPAVLVQEEETKTESIDQVGIDDIREESPQQSIPVYKNEPELGENRVSHQQPAQAESPIPLDHFEEDVEPKREIVEDKSLSEFSSEVIFNVPRATKRSHIQIVKDNQNISSGSIFNDFDKIQESNLMDPLTLKDILKRSNGTSLSEILQQHNLTLTDLLHGKHHAVSIFKSQDSQEAEIRKPSAPRYDLPVSEVGTSINLEPKYAAEPAVEYPTPEEIQTDANKKDKDDATTTIKPLEEKTPKISTRRRFPIGARKKLRMRPMLNDTYKSQLSRDLVTLNARKYSHYRRNVTKSKEWRDIIPSMMQNNTRVEGKNISIEYITTTTASIPEETTITIEFSYNNNNASEEINQEDGLHTKIDDIDMEIETTLIPTIPTEIPKSATEKPLVVSAVKPTATSSGLRRQAFNNRLKRKRLKHKNATTEPPQDDLIKHLFGMGNLVSSSEFIARTEEPKFIEDENKDKITVVDFMTTESTSRTEPVIVQTKTYPAKVSTTPTPIPSTIEEIAKIEIEEILNDSRASAKLSKILMERNMTLSELVEHRERGSSHVHLADIFHNASREPNPPEPFLSKSLLEPISKETYPLRALLDANSHDPNAKATTVNSSFINNINIPVVMDYRNNVNENAENMGIMSLFNNYTKSINKTTLIKDSEEMANSIVNNRNTNNSSETFREARVLNESQDDIVSWNEIFSLMGKGHNNETSSNNLEGLSLRPLKKIRLDEDIDGDGLIVLEDLQHLKDFESNIASGSDEKVDVNAYQNKDSSHQGSGILEKIPSQTKSVTVATASIAGLAMILFLLTYAAFKWKQQRSVIRKKRSFGDERIPTPVFENRKGHKNNSSTRSISPMLQTSNIYTLNTLDSQNGKDSPDYMWDTLRKPFQ